MRLRQIIGVRPRAGIKLQIEGFVVAIASLPDGSNISQLPRRKSAKSSSMAVLQIDGMMGISVPQLCDEDTRKYKILHLFHPFSVSLVHSRNLKRLLLTPISTWLDYHSHADCMCICICRYHAFGYRIGTSVKLVVTPQSYPTGYYTLFSASTTRLHLGTTVYNGIDHFVNLVSIPRQ